MRAIIDLSAWNRAAMETPFGTPQGCRSPEEAMRVPGCWVKSREMREGGRWPRYYGRLVAFSPDKVVVRSACDATDGDLACVWEGTVGEYFAMWECD